MKAWMERMLARPGVEKGRHVPSRHTALDKGKKSAEELDALASSTRDWVQRGMKDDAKL